MESYSEEKGRTAVKDKKPSPEFEMLYGAMINDPGKNPERTGATFDRVAEIVEIILGDCQNAKDIVFQCKAVINGGAQSCKSLAPQDAASLADLLSGTLEPYQCEQAAEHLMRCEFSTDEVIKLHKNFKIPVSHLEDDMLPVKGEGAKIHDSRGKTYVDLDSNYSATNLGNANAEIAKGLYNQAMLLISQKEDRIQIARARFLAEFTGFMPEGLNHFYWQNSGGEAVDKALKIAKAYTGHTGVVAFEGGFHGRTHGAVSVTWKEDYRKPFGLHEQDWVHFAPFGDAAAVEAILAAGKAKTVIVELVQGEEAGIRPASPEFAAELRALCDKYGAVLIVDEVQSGFGRVSDGEGNWFACQVMGVTPDVMVIGKSFGGGYPVTAVVTNSKISSAMKPGYDGSTFGGNPMAMTAALIATRQMKKLNLPKVASERSAQFFKGLSKIAHPLYAGAHGLGLMIGVDFVSKEAMLSVQEAMKEFGAHSSLSTDSTMRWMPPLVITPEEVNQVIDAFKKALDKVSEKE